MTHFAYIHARPDSTDVKGIFYVGKGCRDRISPSLSQRRNAHHRNIVNKYGVENIMVSSVECSSEEIAFELEKGLIKCLRRMGVELVNLTDGGEGQSGYIHTEETRAKMSASHKQLCSTEERREYMRNLACSRTDEQLAKVAETTKSNWANPEYREKVIAAQVASDGHRSKSDKKIASSLINAELAREVLKDPEVKKQAAIKNSQKSKEMWGTPGFREKMAASRAAKKCASAQAISNLK